MSEPITETRLAWIERWLRDQSRGLERRGRGLVVEPLEPAIAIGYELLAEIKRLRKKQA